MKKKKLYILLVFQCMVFIHGFTQNQITAEWLINSSGNEWGIVSDQGTDEDGNVFITGYFNVEMGLGNSSERLQSNQSVFVAKVNEKGNVKWMKKISSTGFCYSNSIIAGRNGSVFVCGNYQGEINENGVSLTSPAIKNTFIIQLDAKGKILWGTSINGTFRNKHLFISQDKDGNLIFAGSYQGELTLDNGHYDSRYYCDIAIAKLNEKGEITGSQILEGKADDFVNDLTVTGNNEIILTGSFEKELRINERTLLSNGQKDIFLVMLDENLRLIQSQQFGGVYDDVGKAVRLDKENNLLLAGTFTDRLQFSKSHLLESSGKCDVFLSKFEGIGKLNWSESFGGAANDYINTMDINSSNDIYLIGSYRGTIEMGSEKIESEEFSSDIFMVKYSEEGDFQLIESFGGENNDFGRTICLDKSNNIYVNGNYSNSIKLLGNASTSHESEDFFVSRLYECGTTNKVLLPSDTTVVATKFLLSVADDFERYFWNGLPGSNELWVDTTGVYTIETIDKHQCISKDTIFVQLNKPPEIDLGGPYSLVQGETITLMAPEGMKEYLWNDHSTQSFIDINTSNLYPGDYSYWVKVKDENGCISHGEAIVEVVEDKGSLSGDFQDTTEQSLKVNLFPNPAKDKLFLNLSGLDVSSKLILELYTQGGILLKMEELDFNERFLRKEIKISSIPSGTYVLKIRNGDKVVIRKVEVF
jgi:hypothetical protein